MLYVSWIKWDFDKITIIYILINTGLLTEGAGKKLKLCGILEGNCAGKNVNCAAIVRDCAMFSESKSGFSRLIYRMLYC